MLKYWHIGLTILGILFIMVLIYLLFSTCFDCEKYNNDEEDLKYVEEMFQCKQNPIQPIQRSQSSQLGDEWCMKIIPVKKQRNLISTE